MWAWLSIQKNYLLVLVIRWSFYSIRTKKLQSYILTAITTNIFLWLHSVQSYLGLVLFLINWVLKLENWDNHETPFYFSMASRARCRQIKRSRTVVNQKPSHAFFTYRVAQKSKPLPNDQKRVWNVLKPVNVNRFTDQIKVRIKHFSIIRSC